MSVRSPARATPTPTTRFDIAPRTVIIGFAIVAGCWLLRELWSIAVLVMVALMLVGTLAPVVNALERRGLRRGLALILVFVGLFAAFAGVLLLTIPPLIGQLLTVLGNAPQRRDSLVQWLESHRMLAPLAGMVKDVDLTAVTGRAGGQLVSYSSRLAVILGYALTTVFLAFYLLADGKRAKGALFALVPRGYHVRLARILARLTVIVGGYMRGQLITSVAMFGVTFVLLTALKVPNALSLAAFAAVVDVIPFIGGLLATAPAAAAAASRGSGVAIAVIAIMFVYQEIESRILVPRVYGRVLRLSPAAVILALLIGGTLLGVIGALLALPVAAGLRAILQEMRVELPGDVSTHPHIRARDEAAERRYNLQSAGAEAVTAAEVAAQIALELELEADVVAQADDPRAPMAAVIGGDGHGAAETVVLKSNAESRRPAPSNGQLRRPSMNPDELAELRRSAMSNAELRRPSMTAAEIAELRRAPVARTTQRPHAVAEITDRRAARRASAPRRDRRPELQIARAAARRR